MSSKGFKWSSHSRPWASWNNSLQLPFTLETEQQHQNCNTNWKPLSPWDICFLIDYCGRINMINDIQESYRHEERSQSFLEILLSTWTTFYPRLSFQQSLQFTYTFRNHKVTPAAEISTLNESSSLQLLLWCSISLIRNLTSLSWCSMLA
jgi:hypothetical protein